MDADWGSSSDEEDAAERARKDAEKLNETMALLEAFNKTQEPHPSYGSAGERFKAERAQAAGKAMWKEKEGRVIQEQHEDAEIRAGMKWHVALGVVIIIVLGFALVGMYKQFSDTFGEGGILTKVGKNATNTAAGVHRSNTSLKSRMPPVGVIVFAVVMGCCIPTSVMLWRQRRSRHTAAFQAQL